MHTLIDTIGPAPDALQARDVGRLSARLIGLRTMSLSVTAQLMQMAPSFSLRGGTRGIIARGLGLR